MQILMRDVLKDLFTKFLRRRNRGGQGHPGPLNGKLLFVEMCNYIVDVCSHLGCIYMCLALFET